MFSRKLFGAVAGAAILAGVTFAAGAAQAEDTEFQNCATYVSRDTTDCFATFTEAVRVATAGAVTDAPTTIEEALRDEELMTRLGAGDKDTRPGVVIPPQFLIGAEFDGAHHSGASRLFYDNEPCTGTTADVDYEYKDLTPIGWSDKISSFVNFNNCYTKHYSSIGYGGVSHSFVNDMTTMPVVLGFNMDNKARSIRWS